jgi:hypothetical protein
MNALSVKKVLMAGHAKTPESNEQESLKPTITPPVIARINPPTEKFPSRSCNIKGAKTATQRGVVETRTTELATVVVSRDVIQVAKCKARNSPDSKANIHSRLFNRRSSDW